MPIGYGNFTVSSCYEGITDALAGKNIANEKMQNAIKKSVWELSGTYPMQGLQNYGPFINFTPFNSRYLPSVFMQPADATYDLRMIDSFFMFYDPNISNPPPFTFATANTGVQLTYQNPRSMENTMNIVSIPKYWTRHGQYIYIAPIPQSAYLCYMRYQHEHPFSNPVADTDVIYFDDDWQDIIEYVAAYRIAQNARLNDIAQNIRNILYGDPKVVDAGGERLDLGLIYSRTSQHRRDQTTALRSLKKRSY